jgi:hypothetical protein
VGEGRYDEIEEEIRRQLIAARPGTQLPSTTPEATAFARTGQPSYAGITSETYVGSDRREPGTITLEGDGAAGASTSNSERAPARSSFLLRPVR